MHELTYHGLLQALRAHIGRDRGVKASDLVREILGESRPADERRLRDLVVELRLQGHHVCAHPSSGYYLASSPEELEETCAFLRARAMQSLQQISRMQRISIPDLVGQMHLPT
jgi:hypothetical protein